jgi:hypothetical protein
MAKFVPAGPLERAFNCPYCGTLAGQSWARLHVSEPKQPVFAASQKDNPPQLLVGACHACSLSTLWIGNDLVYPRQTAFEPPSEDLPDSVRADYVEAGEIAQRSPRGACALLRLCVEKLLDAAEASGDTISQKIGALVQKGLPEPIQRVLDSSRVIGANAVHPGELNLKDDVEVAQAIASAINLIVGFMISFPKKAGELYKRLPDSAREHIEKRDRK